MDLRSIRWIGSVVAVAIGVAVAACGSSDGTETLLGSSHGAGSGPGGGNGLGGGGGGGLGGGCESGQTMCGSLCVDTSTDDGNCGACGVTCQGTCTSSRCVITLAPAGPSGTSFGSIAVSSSDVYYFGSGGLMSVPIAGGSATTIAAGATGAVAVDSTKVYTFGASGLESLPLAGGASTLLAPGNGNALAVGASGACWASVDEGAVNCISFATATGIGEDGGADGGADGGVDPPVLSTLQNNPGGVAGTATDVYYTNAGALAVGGGLAPATGTIGRMSLTETPTVTTGVPDAGPAFVGGQNDPTAIAVDSVNVYWTDTGTTANSFTDGAIMMVPLAGGTPQPLAAAQPSPSGIACDGANVYWTNAGTMANNYADGAIMRVPVGGGAATVMVGGESSPRGIVVDGMNVYWATASGAVKKTAK